MSEARKRNHGPALRRNRSIGSAFGPETLHLRRPIRLNQGTRRTFQPGTGVGIHVANPPTRPPTSSYALSGRVKNAFRPVIDDDEIRAAAVVTSGPPPCALIWLSAAGAVPLSALISGLGTSGTVWGNGLGAVVPGMCAVVPAALMQRMMLIAVTDGQLLVAQWSTLRHRAAAV